MHRRVQCGCNRGGRISPQVLHEPEGETLRKLTLIAVAAVAAVMIVPAASMAAVQATQSMSVKVASQKAGTAKKPANAGKLTITLNTTPTVAAPAFAATKAIVHFDKNMVFNKSKFASCSLAQAQHHAAACNKAQIGGGQATAIVAAAGLNPTLKVTAYNGPGASLWLRLQQPQLAIDSILPGTMSGDSGAYGKKLTVTIPANLQQPLPGMYATLTSMTVAINKVSKGVPYVALKGCTGGSLKFASQLWFTDGSTLSAAATAKCHA
jgi:hypothetical protein